MTLPDEKSNYVHRIGRVGRAERMGLAISLVSKVPEKVWFHGEWCPSRGRNCRNTDLTDRGGCCVWYNEPRVSGVNLKLSGYFVIQTLYCNCNLFQYLAEIEDHLNVTIQQVDSKFEIPMDEFDGKVTYGQKRKNTGSSYKTHVDQMTPVVKQLSDLESKVQLSYLKRHIAKTA